MILPSPETFAQLSHLQRPSVCQLMLPHPATIDTVPHPDVRSALCRTPRDFIAAARGSSINWPKPLAEAVEIDSADGSLYLTQEFEEYALEIKNWSNGRAFVNTYPEIAACLPIRDPWET